VKLRMLAQEEILKLKMPNEVSKNILLF